MEIWIYFDYGIIIKPTYNSCRIRSPTVTSIQTSIVVYKYRRNFPHLHSLISSHLSLSLLCRKEALFLLRRKRLFSHMCGRKDADLGLQLQIKSLTSADHLSPFLNCDVGESGSPLKAAFFGGGIKSIRRSVCEISTTLVLMSKPLMLMLLI